MQRAAMCIRRVCAAYLGRHAGLPQRRLANGREIAHLVRQHVFASGLH